MAIFARSRQATVFRSYLRGRLRAAGVLPDGEAKQYADPSLPTPLLVAFVLGALANADSPLPTEAEVESEVALRLAPAPAEAPPAPLAALPAVPVAVDAQETLRVKRAPWIGNPLPTSSSRA